MAILPAQEDCPEVEFDAEIYIHGNFFLMEKFINDISVDMLSTLDLKYLIEIMLDS